VSLARSREEGRQLVARLVTDFQANREHFRSAGFDETSTRTLFIDRLFSALGWDLGATAPDRDVIFHPRQTIIPTTAGEEEWDADLSEEELDARAAITYVPDYSFRIDEELQFFVEAKRPHVGVRSKAAQFQIKSYAWNKGLSFSVITDFAALRVYDTRLRPDRERPEAGVLAHLDTTCDQYVERWDALWDALSRPAVGT
jgi:predicted type IV restriction endonuclease